MANKKAEYTNQYLANLSLDTSVTPPIWRIGLLGKSVDGAYYTIRTNNDGGVVVDGTGEYTIKIDQPTSSTTYIGKANIGSATTQAVWQIRKYDKNGTETTLYWADSNTYFDNIWDDRTSLDFTVSPSYSTLLVEDGNEFELENSTDTLALQA